MTIPMHFRGRLFDQCECFASVDLWSPNVDPYLFFNEFIEGHVKNFGADDEGTLSQRPSENTWTRSIKLFGHIKNV